MNIYQMEAFWIIDHWLFLQHMVPNSWNLAKKLSFSSIKNIIRVIHEKKDVFLMPIKIFIFLFIILRQN